MAVDTRDAEGKTSLPVSEPGSGAAGPAAASPTRPGPAVAVGASVPIATMPVAASDDSGDLGDEIEDLEEIEELDEVAETDTRTSAPVRQPPRPQTPPPVRPRTPPPVPRAVTAPPVPRAVTAPSVPSSAVPRRMMSMDSGSMGVPAESGRVDLLGDHSGPMRLPGSGPLTAAVVEMPARLEIASPTVLDEALSRTEDERELWQARERTLVARLESAPDMQTAAVLAYELGELRERHLGNVEGALAAHRQALDADPSLRANLWALHRLLERSGQWEDLVDVLDSAALAAATDQERAELHLEKAHVLEIRLADPARARDAYEQAAAFDPAMIAAHRGLERLALASGDHETLARALAALAECMDEPAHALVYLLDLTRLAADRGDFASSREVLDRAAALGVERGRVARERLRVAELADDPEDIIAALEAQIEDASTSQEAAGDGAAVELAALRRRQALVARDRLGDPERAWGFLQDALTRAPGEAVVLADLTDLAERVGRYEELAALFQGLEALSGEGGRSVALSLRRADALLRSGHRSEARALLDALARELPGYLPVLALRERDALQAQDWAALARAHRDVGTHPGQLFDEAGGGAGQPVSELDRLTAAAAATCAGHVQAWLCDDVTAAGVAFGEALAQVPDYGPAMEGLLALYDCGLRSGPGAGGQLEQAAELLERYAATGTENERVHRLERLASIYRELGRLDQVLAVEQRLLALAPVGGADRARVLWRMELTLSLLGRASARIDVLIELAEALDQPAQRAQALLMAARACEAMADGTRAPEAPATPDAPDTGGASGTPGGEDQAEARRTQAARAADLYRQVLELSPSDHYAQAALVSLLRRSGRWQELVAARRAEAELLPEGPAVARALREAAALLRDELGQPAEAAAVYRDLLDRMPGHPGGMQELAEVLAAGGDIDELVDALELESVTADAPRAQVLATLRLGLALERAGRRDQAAAAYRRVLDMAPDATVAATLELGAAPALAAAAVVELADPAAETSARIDALERLAESMGQGAVGSALFEDAGWRWWIEAEAVERAQDAFERAERWASGAGDRDNPGALLGLALLHARHGDIGAAGAALERLSDAVPTPAVRAALLLRAATLAEMGGDRALVARRMAAAVAAAPADASTVVTAAEYPAPWPAPEPAAGAGPGDAPGDMLGDTIDTAALEAHAELLAVRAALAGEVARDDWELERAEILEVCGRLAEAARVAGAVLAAHPGHIRAIELLRRVCRRAGDRAGLAHASLALAKELAGVDSRMELLREAGAIFDQELGNAAMAVWVYRRILAEEPGAPEHQRAMDICRAEGDVRAQLELLTARLRWLSLLTDVDLQAARAKVPLLLERARLRRDLPEPDLRGAERDLALLLAIDSQSAEGWAARAEVAEALGTAEQAAEHWRRYLGVEPDADRRAAAERSLARLLAERLDDPEGALTQLEQVVRHAPDDLEVRERLVALLVRTESWPRAVRELGEIARRRKDARARSRDQLRMAEILRDRIGDRQGAAEALSTARNLDPANLEVIRALADLATPTRRAQVLRQGARDLRAGIAAQPAQVPLYARLAELTEWQEDDEARFYVVCALSMLGEVPAAQREVLNKVGADLAEGRLPEGSIGPEDLGQRLLAIRAEGAHWAGDIWACVVEAVSRTLGLEPAALGFGRGERLAAKHLDRTYPAVARMARAFALLDEAEFYVAESKPGYARALQLDKPVVCLGADVARGDSPRARFALGRCLLEARLGTGTMNGIADADVQRFFVAAAQVSGAVVPDAVAAAAGNAAAVESAGRGLQKHLGRRERRQLTQLNDRMSKIDVSAWRHAVERTAMRGGALLAGDLRALPALLAPAQGGAVDRSDPDVLDLLAWVVGDDHLWLRRHLGLTMTRAS
jgi:tetratricopeptide (TPR) repeat protein